jgi:hypothetical protein
MTKLRKPYCFHARLPGNDPNGAVMEGVLSHSNKGRRARKEIETSSAALQSHNTQTVRCHDRNERRADQIRHGELPSHVGREFDVTTGGRSLRTLIDLALPVHPVVQQHPRLHFDQSAPIELPPRAPYAFNTAQSTSLGTHTGYFGLAFRNGPYRFASGYQLQTIKDNATDTMQSGNKQRKCNTTDYSDALEPHHAQSVCDLEGTSSQDNRKYHLIKVE